MRRLKFHTAVVGRADCRKCGSEVTEVCKRCYASCCESCHADLVWHMTQSDAEEFVPEPDYSDITVHYVGLDQARSCIGKHFIGDCEDSGQWERMFEDADAKGFRRIYIHIEGLTNLAYVEREQIEEGAI